MLTILLLSALYQHVHIAPPRRHGRLPPERNPAEIIDFPLKPFQHVRLARVFIPAARVRHEVQFHSVGE